MKYVIDVPDGFKDDVLMPSSTQGRTLGLPIKVMGLQYVVPTGVKILPYTEPDKNVKNNYVHLCNSCLFKFPDCTAIWPKLKEDVLYGDDEGINNICCCPYYTPKNYYIPESKERKAIENEVWEFINSITDNMSRQDRLECFGEGFIDDLTHNISYQEARTKHNIWQQAKREEESRIKIGDEVEYVVGGETTRFVVMDVTANYAYGFKFPCDYDDAGEYCDLDDLCKTGRSFPQVAELLEAMEEE